MTRFLRRSAMLGRSVGLALLLVVALARSAAAQSSAEVSKLNAYGVLDSNADIVSKLNTYGVLDSAIAGNSKLNAYGVLESAIVAASKLNAYGVLRPATASSRPQVGIIGN